MAQAARDAIMETRVSAVQKLCIAMMVRQSGIMECVHPIQVVQVVTIIAPMDMEEEAGIMAGVNFSNQAEGNLPSA